MENNIPYLNEWLDLARAGNFQKAHDIYFEKLFAAVIQNFQRKNANIDKGGILFSILGYSPEPIILTAKVVAPEVHIIFTTEKGEDNEYLDKYLQSDFKVVYLPNEAFDTVYKALKEQIVLNPSSKVVLDITGGKKSMVASAAIFGKDYGCKIVYVDFSEYIKDLRKPMPGSELLTIVYDPNKDQPEPFNQ